VARDRRAGDPPRTSTQRLRQHDLAKVRASAHQLARFGHPIQRQPTSIATPSPPASGADASSRRPMALA